MVHDSPEMTKCIVFNDVASELADKVTDFGVGWTLRRAEPREVQNPVRRHMKLWAERRGFSVGLPSSMQRRELRDNVDHVHPFETEDELLGGHRVLVLEKTENDAMSDDDLRTALAICDAELMVGFSTCNDFSSQRAHWPDFIGFQSDIFSPRIDERPSVQSLQDIQDTLAVASNGIDSEVLKASQLFMSLDRMPDDSNMKHLGYFVVVESLLSHKPTQNDPADSIMRQLVRNLNLIENRLRLSGRSLGFDVFGDTKIEKVVKKLYDYRSSIAHGSDLAPPLLNLQKLGLNIPVQNLLRQMVRRVLFAAMSETQLVIDLK